MDSTAKEILIAGGVFLALYLYTTNKAKAQAKSAAATQATIDNLYGTQGNIDYTTANGVLPGS